jgi:GNAT superfamily N-acetyltransferase
MARMMPAPPISSALIAFAEDPDFFIEPPEGSDRHADERFCLTIGPHRRWAGVCRLRLPDDAEQIAGAVAEIRQLTAGIEHVMWNVGSSATPMGLPERLRALGLGDPEPPFEPLVAAMALEHEPLAVHGVEVRRIETLEEHLAGLEIMLASATWSDAAAAAERERAEEVFERRQRRGGLQWLAHLDGRPVAFAVADRGPAGLYLGGGATLPEARGRGCYRALVRARWDEAIRLGLPGLAVQAQYGSSAPILRRLGFAEVATVHTLQ